jgi:hypothetical protein
MYRTVIQRVTGAKKVKYKRVIYIFVKMVGIIIQKHSTALPYTLKCNRR